MPNHIIIEQIVIRTKWLISTVLAVAIAISAHGNLLPFTPKTQNIIQLVCLIVVSISNAPIGRFNSQRVDISKIDSKDSKDTKDTKDK